MADDKQNQIQSDESRVDILLFGAHPDDVEWGAGGTVLKLQPTGTSFGIVDLTRGEMGSRGRTEERDKEAEDAASWMGARFRENLGLPDCGVIDSVENRKQIASVIREWRPKLVLAPYWTDRRPDHAAAGHLIRNAAI
jgi:N-acetylglucosamine malate deacetylase 1